MRRNWKIIEYNAVLWDLSLPPIITIQLRESLGSEIYFLVWKNEKKFFKIFFPPALEKVLIYISRENFILEEEYDV